MTKTPADSMPVTDEELIQRYPGRAITHDTKAIYRGWLEHRLLIARCTECGRWNIPTHDVCSACWSRAVVPSEVSGDGTIFMYVLLHQGPPGIDYSTPYPVVTVELDEQPGLRITATVVGASNDQIRIGRRVALDWIERDGAPVPAFRIVRDAAST